MPNTRRRRKESKKGGQSSSVHFKKKKKQNHHHHQGPMCDKKTFLHLHLLLSWMLMFLFYRFHFFRSLSLFLSLSLSLSLSSSGSFSGLHLACVLPEEHPPLDLVLHLGLVTGLGRIPYGMACPPAVDHPHDELKGVVDVVASLCRTLYPPILLAQQPPRGKERKGKGSKTKWLLLIRTNTGWPCILLFAFCFLLFAFCFKNVLTRIHTCQQAEGLPAE